MWLPGMGNQLQERGFTLVPDRHETMSRLPHKSGSACVKYGGMMGTSIISAFTVITQLGLETQNTLLMNIDEHYLLSFAAYIE